MSDPITRTYDPKNIKATFGDIPIVGYAEGTFISIVRAGDGFEKTRGADGSVNRVNKNMNDFDIEITLMQGTPTNTAFSTAYNIDINLNTGIVPFRMVDLLGASIFTSESAWIAKDPDGTYSDSIESRTWKISTGQGIFVNGGNN